jgi:hypothetical protein
MNRYLILTRGPGNAAPAVTLKTVDAEDVGPALVALRSAAFSAAASGRHGDYPFFDTFNDAVEEGFSDDDTSWTAEDGTIILIQETEPPADDITERSTGKLTVQQAERWLEEHPLGKLRAVVRDPYYGKREATICTGERGGPIVLLPKSRKRGFALDWSWVQKIREPAEWKKANATPKFIREAKSATFTNPFIRKCLSADPAKTPFENGLTTGTDIDGKIISLRSFGKQHPWIEQEFRQALKERRHYISGRVPFRGYEATLELWEGPEQGDIYGLLSLEYKDCTEGYYYQLVNDERFIGHDTN